MRTPHVPHVHTAPGCGGGWGVGVGGAAERTGLCGSVDVSGH